MQNQVFKMKALVQEELSGCGIASVAVLAGISYKQSQRIANRLGIHAEDTRLWSDTRHVRTLLKQHRIQCSAKEKPFTSWEALPDTALLAIKWHLERSIPFWHWVVFWRSPEGPLVLDSKAALRTNTRTDFGRIKPKWFITINISGAKLPAVDPAAPRRQ